MKGLIALVSALLLAGCAGLTEKQDWKSQPEIASADNTYFSAQISPVCGARRVVDWIVEEGGCEALLLKVTNKSDKTIEINWNKTVYIAGAQSSGGFMFEGVVYADRNAPKSPDMVFPNSSLTKMIYPNNLVSYKSGQYGGWEHAWLPLGENGVYLSTVVDGNEISERVVSRLTVAPAANK